MSTQIKTPEEIANYPLAENLANACCGGHCENAPTAGLTDDELAGWMTAAISERSITINLDTGEWLSDTRITGEEGARVAASVLPGVTPEQVSGWYSEWLIEDAIEADRAQRAAIHQDYRDDQEMVKDGGGYVNVSWAVETENGKHWFESDMRLTNAQAVGMFQGIGEAAQ